MAFAQLHIDGRNEGVHAFVVPLRDAQGNALPGIRIADCGHKLGLNGIDNGRIWYIDLMNIFLTLSDILPDSTIVDDCTGLTVCEFLGITSLMLLPM